jgi:hypothetical protein
MWEKHISIRCYVGEAYLNWVHVREDYINHDQGQPFYDKRNPSMENVSLVEREC